MNDLTETKEVVAKHKKPIPMYRPNVTHNNNNNHVETERPRNSVFKHTLPNEMKSGVRNLTIYGLSVPAGKTRQKRMMHNLQNSKYINDYMNHYLCIEQLTNLGDHEKFLLTYGLNLLDAYLAPVEQQVIETPKDTPKESDTDNLKC